MYYLVRTNWNGDDCLGGYVYSTDRDQLLHTLYELDTINSHPMTCDFETYKQYYNVVGNYWDDNDPDLPFLGDEYDYEHGDQYVPFKIEELDEEEFKEIIEA